MFTVAMICAVLGFFLLYNTSRKAKLTLNGPIEKWAASHRSRARVVGLSFIAAAFLILTVKDGLGSGVINALLMLMAAACIIIAIAPFRYLRVPHIALIIAGSLFFELIV